MKIQLAIVWMVIAFAACKSKQVQTTNTQTIANEMTTTHVEQLDSSINLKLNTAELDSLLPEEAIVIQPSELYGCWTDSREENIQGSGIKLYRPCDYENIPRSRFRFKMILNKDATCSWLTLASNDAHKMKKGTWFLEEGNRLEVQSETGEIVMSFSLYAVNKELLKIIAN